MLRSLIAHVFFLFAAVGSSLAGAQSARAEVPLEFATWLNVATDFLDHQIGQELELPWRTLDSVVQSTAEGYGCLVHQCRLGVGGTRGLQLVHAIDLVEELRHSGVAGVVTPAKNWNFPAENFELQSYKIVQGNVRSKQSSELKAEVSPVVAVFSNAIGHASSAQRSLLNGLARLATQVNEQMDRLEKEAYRPAEPLVRSASRAWENLVASASSQRRDEVFDWQDEPSAKSSPSKSSATFDTSTILSYWQEVSNFAQAKLNWLTSKVRHIVENGLKSIEPQFLILELVPLA